VETTTIAGYVAHIIRGWVAEPSSELVNG
jgi:hypothetical protein